MIESIGIAVIAFGLLIAYKFLLKRPDGKLTITWSLLIGICASPALGKIVKPAVNAVGGVGSALGITATVITGVLAVIGIVFAWDVLFKKGKPHKMAWVLVALFPVMAATSGISILTSVSSTLNKSVTSVNQSVTNVNFGK